MSVLLLDVGNSRLKWGLGEDGEIHRTGHIAQQRLLEQGLQILTGKLPRRINEVFVSNVAGASFATRLSGVIGAHYGCDVHYAKSEREAFGVRNSYKQPRRMGVDRWVAMIAAFAELQHACLIVDAGTAVTIDAVDDDGHHLGGQIIPGVGLMAQALSTSTSDIPPVARRAKGRAEPLAMFANNTPDAVQQGALNAVTGAVERALECLRSNAYDPWLVLTGGDASRILGALGEEPLHRPNLVLEGLLYMRESAR